jgi:hypothetical protein
MAEESGDQGDTSKTKDEVPSRAAEESLDKEDEDAGESEPDDDDDDDEEDEDDDEPKLKYARLTSHLSSVYRNGDATSAFLVAGDKMVGFPRRTCLTAILNNAQFIGTHNGNIVRVPADRTNINSFANMPHSMLYHYHPSSPSDSTMPTRHPYLASPSPRSLPRHLVRTISHPHCLDPFETFNLNVWFILGYSN